MPDRHRNHTVLAVLVLVSLVLVTVDYRQGEDGSLASLQRGALAAFGPAQEGFAAAVRPVGGFLSTIGELSQLRERNAALEAELAKLREGQASVAGLEKENEELRAQLDIRKRLELTTTGAQVIADSPEVSEWSVLLDSGADDGLAPGMPVINADGLVGRLTEVTSEHARLQLLTSPRSGIVARVADTGETGLLRGRGTRPFRFEMTDAEAEVEVGSEVVSRTFAGSAIPDGIPVGEVEEVPETKAAGEAHVSVRPFVDYSSLNVVQVVLDAPVAPADLDEDDLVENPDPPQPPSRDELETPGPESPPPDESDAGLDDVP